jgi:cysteine desulfurase
VAAIPGAVVHCAAAPRLPSTSHVAFPGVSGQDLMIRLDLRGFAVSTGSACGSGTMEVSPTLAAMGMGEAEALGSLRVSFGTGNTEGEVDALLAALAGEVASLRQGREAVAG